MNDGQPILGKVIKLHQLSIKVRQLVTLFVHPTPKTGSMEIAIVMNSFTKWENRPEGAKYATFWAEN